MDSQSKRTASFRLDSYTLRLNNELFDANTLWCRFAEASREGWGDSARFNQHSFYELHYAISGAMIVRSPDCAELKVAASEFVLIPPHCVHAVGLSEQNSEKLVCGLTITPKNGFVAEALEGLSPLRVYQDTPNMRTLTELMRACAYQEREGTTVSLEALLSCLLIEILHQVRPVPDRLSVPQADEVSAAPGNAGGSLRKKSRNELLIEELQLFISEKSTAFPTAEDAARHVGLSLRQLNRLVGKTFGCSVSGLIAQEKLAVIKRMLMMPELSLDDIAEQTGFHSEYALCRFFKRYEGMAIGLYRRSVRSC